MTTISVFAKLIFGPEEGKDHIVRTSLEAPAFEDFGDKFVGQPMERDEPRRDEDHPPHHARRRRYQHPVHAHLAHEKHSEHAQRRQAGQDRYTTLGPDDYRLTDPSPHRALFRTNENFTRENARAVRATATRLGISERDLSTIIGYETIGSYSPSKQGLRGHTGLIQFGREEQRKYGVHPGQTFPEQMHAVESYLRDRGVKPGMGLRDVYSTVLSGAPGRYSARDIGGTVDEHVARMQRDRSAQAERFLASGYESQKRLLGAGSRLAPEGQISAVGGAPASAFIMHHTGGGGTVEDVQRTLRARHLGVQYIMDREGNIYRTGGPGEHQIRHGSGLGVGLSNANTVGMEIIARHDADVTRAQVAAARAFIRKNYPTTPVYGHGEVNPEHKEATEGLTVSEAVRADRAARAAATGQP